MKPCRVDHFIIQDGLKEVIFVLCLEGCVTTEHLIEQHAHGPPVYCRPVEHFLEDLCKENNVRDMPRVSDQSCALVISSMTRGHD